LSARPGPLTDQEAEGLEEVGAQRRRLALRFVRGGLTDPRYLPGFVTRAEYARQAAVGLDRQRRPEAEQLPLAELRAKKSEARQRQDLALAAVALGDLSPEMATTAAAELGEALSKETNFAALSSLARGLSAAAARLGPREAAEAAALLTQAMTRTTGPGASQAVAEGLSVLAARLEPQAAAALLTQAMTRTTDPFVLRALAEGLSAVAARLGPQEAATACGQAAT